ncbi:UDP-N-acetylglucosamine 1-carboxyvinyltransferase [Motilimonas sp. E26]|uniref:UDP-N-acetylglucosamine 1-carboxyvinyltransferase n=1 Tax=Motilimonas sp. E26 TaxID=2865674 RepID=UPI001E40AF94|nr:UDP-N-acetylglucosamine 1-carboxyvinyltransferase [Motilimonas sp. E26]MCE0558951.1 UDP-N-acetylglucosamine 1-carboxyvinyltransferase [Motilimonas sp. E26]
MKEVYQVPASQSLQGDVIISGAKNAVLPLMAATLLCRGTSIINNVPQLDDVDTMADVLRYLGAKVELQGSRLTIDTRECDGYQAPYHLVTKMRASIYVLGPLLARLGQASVALPGGCAWGPRPVDLHIAGMQALSAKVELSHGNIHAHAGRLKGADFTFPISSVGATVNLLLAAVLADGTTRLFNAAIEPEIDNLVDQLNAMGAQIFGKGSNTLVIEGVAELQAAEIDAIADRIEAGTYLIAAAITKGKLTVKQVQPSHLTALIDSLTATGALVYCEDDSITLDAQRRTLKPISIKTGPYPLFATDLQPQWMTLCVSLAGVSQVTDTVYPERFQHVAELCRLGANIRVKGNTASIIGTPSLSGAPVKASDLRAGAALILAGLIATEHTDISDIHHLDRGYQNLIGKFANLGVTIHRHASHTTDCQTKTTPLLSLCG